MLFNLHADYVKAAAPRARPHAGGRAVVLRSEPPPRRVRAYVARALVGAAQRVDRESVRRAIA
jgi:hypothetical protein